MITYIKTDNKQLLYFIIKAFKISFGVNRVNPIYW